MYKKNILSVSHTDLDGLSAQIVLRSVFGEIKRMNATYGKIEEYLNIIDDYCSRTEPHKVFITDLAFKYKELERLNEIAKKHSTTKFIFIDHHPFEEEYKHLVLPNFTILISDKASATKLTYLFLKANYSLNNKELAQYVEYVNAYDIWLKNEKEFKVGFVYNELFWSYKIEYFWSIFKDNYSLRNKDKEQYRELIKKKDKLFNKLEKSGRVMKFSDRILLIFLDDFQGHVTIDYPDFASYVIIRSYGGVSVRLREDAVNEGKTKNNIVKKILD
jgi:oligoribonuclease NrnB/cAMP/cGMP phosphodiesterase (DHH superfamily)